MSYQVLARKWRPQTFSELVGQQHVVDAITNALDNNKLHHAYLFTGTRGVGKTTIARIFSKSLNCEEGQSANPCGKCATCLDISEGRFVDLLEIDAASRTKVEDTRELLDNVQYKPTRGKYKVYLIDEVHMLSKHSFNALLKTLEEPPPHVKFLLATTDPQKLPVTILSRCLQFSLKSLSREQIQTQLATILTAEQLNFEAPALSQIARAAAGSMRDALSLTDQAIAQGNNQVTLDTVVSMLGLLDKNQILRLAKCICERDANNAMKQLDEICADSPDYSQVLSQLLALLHQVALTQIVPDICKLDTNVAKPIYTLSQAVSPEHIQLLYQIGLNGKRDLPYAPDALTGLQMTIMRMIAFTPAQSLPLEVSALAVSPAEAEAELDPRKQTKALRQAEAISSDSEHSTNNKTTVDEIKSTPRNTHADDPPISEHDENSHVGSVQFEQDTGNEDSSMAQQQEDHAYAEAMLENIEQYDATANYAAAHHPEKHETEEDTVAQLQDLLDMEQDIASYERDAVGDENGKKSEPAVDEANKHISPEDQKQTVSENKSASENAQPEGMLSDIRANEPASQLIDKPELYNDIPSSHASEQEISLGNSERRQEPLTAYLNNGEKLTKAAQIDKWSAFVDSLDVKGLARQLLIHGRSTGIKDNCLLLEISHSHHHLNEQSSIKSVREALYAKFQRDIDVKVEYAEVDKTPYQLQLEIEEMRLVHARKVIESDTAIQELMKAFDATVVPDSIQSR